MDKVGLKEKFRDNKLIVVLIILITMIVGLTIWIVVVRVNSGQQTSYESEVEEEEDDDDEMIEIALMEGETLEDAKRRMAEDEEWERTRDEIKARATELLDKNPPDVDGFRKVFDEGYRKAEELGRSRSIDDLVYLEYEMLTSKNLRREALDSLVRVNLDTIVDCVYKYNIITMTIELAKEYGDNAILTKYNKLREEAEPCYNEDVQEIQDFVDTVGAGEDSENGGRE